MTRQQKILTAQEASIQSATVEIKIITVGGKQMTLAVFRQLPRLSVIDYETLELKGVPWGQVRYHTGSCIVGEPHIHIVWQKDEVLYQSYTREQAWLEKYNDLRRQGRSLEAHNYLSRHGELYRSLMSLDQLFIAV